MKKKDSNVFLIDFNSKEISFVEAFVNSTQTIINKIKRIEYTGYLDTEFINLPETKLIIMQAINESQFNFKKGLTLVGVPAHFCNVELKNVAYNLERKRKFVESDLNEIFKKANLLQHKEQKIISVSAIKFLYDNQFETTQPINIVMQNCEATVSLIDCDVSFINFVKQCLFEKTEKIEFVSNVLTKMLMQNKIFKSLTVDFGYLSSSVSYAEGDGLLGLRTFNLGGGNIISHVAAVYGLSFHNAKVLIDKIDLTLSYDKSKIFKLKINNELKVFKYSEIANQVKLKVEEFCELVIKCFLTLEKKDFKNIDYYFIGESSKCVKGIDFCIENYLNVNVNLINSNIINYHSECDLSFVSILNFAKCNLTEKNN